MDFVEHALEQEFDSKNISKKIRSSARARDIALRSRLSSADHNVLEEHDQFWKDHKLLLKLFQVLGVMPVSRKLGRITFSWTSSATIYAILFYLLTSVLVLLVGYQRVKIVVFSSKKFDEYIYSIIFIVYLIPHFCTPFVGWGVAKEVAVYKNSWTHFQLKYFRITGKSLKFPRLNLLIIVISSGCLILAVVFLLSLSALLAGFTLYHTTAYLHIITMINMNCALWYINCRAIGDASKSLADSLEEDINDQCSAYIVAHFRILWLSLSEILQRLGNAYSRTYSTYSLFMFMNITISVYGFMSEIIDSGLVFTFKVTGLMVDSVYCLVLLFVFCDCSNTATIKITKRVKNILMDIDLSKIDEITRREVDLFIVAIKLNPPVVSLKGYGNVDRRFFTSNITMMAIYLIVLLQFKLSFQMLSNN